MTSYNTEDNYYDGSITGVIIRILDDAFLLQSDGTYYCIPRTQDILYLSHQLLDKQVKCTGLIKMYQGNIAGIENHVFEFIVKKLEKVN